MYPTIKEILAKWNLFLNDDKTEFTRFYLAEMNEKNNAGKSIRKLKEEEWRSTKALGSLMCSIKDIQRRCQLANVAFLSLDKCWLQGTKISLPIKIRLYDALVVSVMIYNGNSWSAPLRRHRLPQRTWTIFADKSSSWPELATLWPKAAKITNPC